MIPTSSVRGEDDEEAPSAAAAEASKMSTGKRIAKRSILGTRVVAPGLDGRYYPAIIQSVTTTSDLLPPYTNKNSSSENRYLVRFDNSRKLSEFSERELIGPGFGCVATAVGNLLGGQRVYLTHLGREIEGTVGVHDVKADIVSVLLPTGEQLTARPEEIRLLESRKSSRLMVRQTSNQDFSKLGELGGLVEERRKTERRRLNSEISSNSDSSEVFSSRKRRGSETMSESGSSSEESARRRCREESAARRRCRPSSPVMSECTAAMVLMDLYGSPSSRSSHFSGQSDVSSGQMSPSSSGVSSLGSSWASPSLTPPFPLPHSPTTTSSPFPPSPTLPSESTVSALLELSGEHCTEKEDSDEGIVSDHDYEADNSNKKKTEKVRTIYQCTWPACLQQETECHLIERHVRRAHLGRADPVQGEEHDHEEEFYYTEFELPETETLEFADDLPEDYLVVEEGEIVSANSTAAAAAASSTAVVSFPAGAGREEEEEEERNLSSSLSDRSSSVATPTVMAEGAVFPPSPVPHHHHHQMAPLLADHYDMARPPHENPEYTAAAAPRTGCHQLMSGSTPTYATIISPTSSLGVPIAIPITTFTIAGGTVPGKYIRLSPKPCLSTSPKSPVRRPRGDAKKCRKVYGMDQRDLWCTQCKWKKACTRFGEATPS